MTHHAQLRFAWLTILAVPFLIAAVALFIAGCTTAKPPT